MAYKPRPQPNPIIDLALSFTNEFFQETTDFTNDKILTLITRNANLGGDPIGYTYANIRYSENPQAHDKTVYLPEILPELEKDAEALYLRAGRLHAMRTKLHQALTSIFSRCNQDMQLIRDAVPDAFAALTSLDVYRRSRPQGFLLRAAPTLAAPYRVIDESLTYRDRYRLLD